MSDKKLEMLKLIRNESKFGPLRTEILQEFDNILADLEKQSLSKKALLHYMLEDMTLLLNKPQWSEADKNSIFFYLGNLMARIYKELDNDL